MGKKLFPIICAVAIIAIIAAAVIMGGDTPSEKTEQEKIAAASDYKLLDSDSNIKAGMVLDYYASTSSTEYYKKTITVTSVVANMVEYKLKSDTRYTETLQDLSIFAPNSLYIPFDYTSLIHPTEVIVHDDGANTYTIQGTYTKDSVTYTFSALVITLDSSKNVTAVSGDYGMKTSVMDSLMKMKKNSSGATVSDITTKTDTTSTSEKSKFYDVVFSKLDLSEYPDSKYDKKEGTAHLGNVDCTTYTFTKKEKSTESITLYVYNGYILQGTGKISSSDNNGTVTCGIHC